MYPRAWKSFRGLTLEEKAIAAYLLTGDQTNRIGLYDFSIGKAIEDLETLPQTFKKGFDRVCQTLGWKYDNVNRVLFIPSWWKWNPPENPNVLIGNLKDLFEVAVSPLYDEFKNNIEHLRSVGKGCFDLTETFTQTLVERYPKPYPKQQEQEQEQEQEKETLSPEATLPIPKRSEAVPFQEIIDTWNTHAPELLPKAKLTDKRQPKIKAAWKEHPSLDWWQSLFADINLSDWHSHRDKWQECSFDWILKNRNEMREKMNAKKGNGRGPQGVSPKARNPGCPSCRGSGLYKSGETPDHQPIMSTCDCDKNGPHETRKQDPALPATG